MTALALAFAAAAAAQPALPPPAGAAPWELVVAEQEVLIFVDPDSVRRTGTRVRVRMLAVGPRAMADGTRAAAAEVDMDCAGRTATLLRRDLYGADRRPIGSTEVPLAERRATPVGAAGGEAAVFRRVCGSAESGG